MGQMKNEKKAKAIADERMSLIAPLLAPGLDKAQVREIRNRINADHALSDRTIDRYMKAYSENGFEGLMPAGKNPGAVYKIVFNLPSLNVYGFTEKSINMELL